MSVLNLDRILPRWLIFGSGAFVFMWVLLAGISFYTAYSLFEFNGIVTTVLLICVGLCFLFIMREEALPRFLMELDRYLSWRAGEPVDFSDDVIYDNVEIDVKSGET